MRFLVPLAALVLGILLWMSLKEAPPVEFGPAHSMQGWQYADVPPGYPLEEGGEPFRPPLDSRVELLGAFDRFLVPLAPRFDHPLGSENGALAYNAQPFGAMNRKRGGLHTGDDLNGIGGMNSDLGDPVFCAGNGRVIYAGTPSRGWGKTVIVAHRAADGRLLESMYAHLHRIMVKEGDLVSRGQQVGELGGAEGVYLAHLHFEMREFGGAYIGRGYTLSAPGALDPAATVEGLRGAGADCLGGEALGALLAAREEARPEFPEMDAESALRFSEIMGREEGGENAER